VTAYKPGDRVVCPDPDGGSFVGAVAHVDTSGGLTVTYSPAQVVRASPDEVRPAMPRDLADVERWGDWWYIEGRPVHVVATIRGFRLEDLVHGSMSIAALDWRGPVARPPEVRS
jgi:hypothetical protein